jgi:hypothetical protein
MAGGRANRTRRAGLILGLALLVLVPGVTARSQVPGRTGPAPPGDALVGNPSPPLPPAQVPIASRADVVDLIDPLDALPGPMSALRPWNAPDLGTAPTGARVETEIFDTITASVFDRPGPNPWRALPFSTLLGEGWSESWVPSPRGSGGAPRQGWINAVTGHLNRGWFFTFAQGFNDPPEGNAYLGSYTLMTPLSRRLMLITNIPFVLRNVADSGLPTIDPSGPTVTTSRSHTGFGDISFTPRVLLHETKDFSLTAELAVLTPTGDRPLARNCSLTPAVGFWTDLAGGWAIRGGIADLIPTQGGGNTLISQLAVGRTTTGHDVPLLGDFTYYLAAVAETPLSDGDHTSVTLTPGLRTHLGRDWYLLAGLPTPLTKARVADLGMILWFVKAW